MPRFVKGTTPLAANLRKARHKTPAGADVWTLALQRMTQLFDTFDKTIIMFSAGKDSMAVLEAAIAAATVHRDADRLLPLRVIFFDEEVIPYECEDYTRRTFARPEVAGEWYCLPVKHRNGCSNTSPWWWPWAPEAADLWVRPLPPEAITSLPGFTIDPPAARPSMPEANGLFTRPADGNVALAMGIRASESLVRHYAVTGRPYSHDNWIVPYGNYNGGRGTAPNVWKAYPIYDWSDQDVWAGPATLGWDYNQAYDMLEAAGVTVHHQRIAPGFGETPTAMLERWCVCFPDVWERMPERVPGAGAAYRYGRGELYAYRARIPKPAHQTWPEFIAGRVAKQADPEVQAFARKRMRLFIRRHYYRTTAPILPSTRHPETGVDWNFILKVATQSDTKERMQPQMRIVLLPDGTRTIESWRAWIEAYREAVKNGATAAELGHPKTLPPDPWPLVPAYAREQLPGLAPEDGADDR